MTRRLRLFLATVVAGVMLPISSLSSPAIAVQEEPAQSILSIDQLSPEVLRLGENLVIRATVAGDGASSSDWDFAYVFLSPGLLGSPTEIDQYLTGDHFRDIPVAEAEVADLQPTVLPNGQGWQFDIVVPAEELTLYESTPSATLGLTLRLSGTDVDLDARSLITFSSEVPHPRTAVNVLGFDLLTAANPQIPANQTQAAIQQSADLAQIAGVSLAVLPGFFDDSDDEGASDAIDLDQHISSVKEHRQSILQRPIELIVLPLSDADVSLAGATEQSELTTLALDSRTAAAESPTHAGRTAAKVFTNVVIASEQGFTQESLRQLTGNTVVAPDSFSLTTDEYESITPTSRLEVSLDDGLTVVDTDRSTTPNDDAEDLSIAVVDGWTAATALINQPVKSVSGELILRQRLRNLGISVGLEDPDDTRILSVPLRVSRETFDPALVARTRALLDNSWIIPLSFSGLVGSTPSVIPRNPVSASTVANNPTLQTVEHQLAPLAGDYILSSGIAEATPLGKTLVAPYAADVLQPLSFGIDTTEREAAVAAARKRLSSITRAIDILPQGTINVINRNVKFPVSVINNGDVAISLEVSIVPGDPRLQMEKPVFVQLAAGQQQTVEVPIIAVGSGDVSVILRASTPAGVIIDDSQKLIVRVRANWEDTVTITFAVALSALFIFGIIRTIIKRKRRNGASDITAHNQSTGEQE